MAERTRGPAPHPCGSCPYRRDVPSGVWDPEEYDKLPRYDGDTAEQPIAVFLCHQQNGRLCSGWVGCHDMEESMALRIAALSGVMSPEEVDAALDYECPVPLWSSGTEAAEHGMREVKMPSDKAGQVMENLRRKRARKALG
jgi:hypothetical protein